MIYVGGLTLHSLTLCGLACLHLREYRSKAANSTVQRRRAQVVLKFARPPHACSFYEQNRLPMRAAYAPNATLPRFRCADRRNPLGFITLRNVIAPKWAESDYFAPSNAIVHKPLILRTPICGFSRDIGESRLNRGACSLCVCNSNICGVMRADGEAILKPRRRVAPASHPSRLRHPPASRRANPYPTLLQSAFNNIRPHSAPSRNLEIAPSRLWCIILSL